MSRAVAVWAALALLAAPTAEAKRITWLLVFEQSSAVPGQTITLRTAATGPRYAPPPRPGGAALGAYLVRGRFAGPSFVRTGPPLRLGTLQTDLSYRGRRSFVLPRVEPGVYHAVTRFGDRFDVGRDLLLVRSADHQGLLEKRAAVLALAAGFVVAFGAFRRRVRRN